jgi:Myotubularin-like phosphatase domain
LCLCWHALVKLPIYNSDIQTIARYRSKGRLPVVVWRDTITGAILCRSSQPLSGTIVYGNAKCSEDSQLLDMYRTLCNTSSNGKLLLLDARSPTAVFGNQLTGAGIEVINDVTQLTNTQVLFAGIENIHSVRRSYDALGNALADDTSTITSDVAVINTSGVHSSAATNSGATAVVQHEHQFCDDSTNDSNVNNSATQVNTSSEQHAQNGVTTSNSSSATAAAAAAVAKQQQTHSLRPAVVNRVSNTLHFNDAESNYISALQSPLQQRQLDRIQQSSNSSNSNSPHNQTATATAAAAITSENSSTTNTIAASWAHYLFGAYGALISNSSSGHGELQLALNTGTNWLEQLHNSHWLEHVRRILATAVVAAKAMRSSDTAVNITLHCSDGWDRTAQLSSTIQLLLDPFYRTLAGFAVLIEKEWCSFGHKMQDRCGHLREKHSKIDTAVNGGTGFSETEFSPIFVQWLDCVWQVVRMYPTAFEFNTELLVYIGHHTYRCVVYVGI